MPVYSYEYTDTFAGEANYCWVKRGKVNVPELTHYGYDGLLGYAKASRAQHRQVMIKVKAALGLTSARGVTEDWGGQTVFRPYGMATVLFVDYCDVPEDWTPEEEES